MIPREILKKIRQAETRATRFVTESGDFHSFQPLAEFVRIPASMKYGNHRKGIFLDGKIDAVGFEAFKTDFACVTSNPAKKFRLKVSPLQCVAYFCGKFATQAGTFIFVPGNCFGELQFGGEAENQARVHFQPKRCFSSAWTCSQGIPSWGFFSKSASRRSSSAICSGVKSGSTHPSSSPNSSQTCSINARFSSDGIGRIFSMSSVALMSVIYRFGSRAQARFLRGIHQSLHRNPLTCP
jgi:hypothetical protein